VVVDEFVDATEFDIRLKIAYVLTLERIKTILTTEIKGKPAKPEDFADLSFVRELDQSDYIDGLYKRR